ncbi:putative Phospholipid phosphatase 1 [Hypsibius exemplaris]|uniref:Phospholipid phosphatase 1 n=1 Tax=Hypsibius exemplaris TaxID=2072580 RepID=A0A1W0WH60_HYPEX|nr:putative Phospholipid phosphatase 1 [Hypsibius exemplaris]
MSGGAVAGKDAQKSPMKHRIIHWKAIVSLRNAIELGSIVCACIPFLVVRYLGAYRRGFFCSDTDIMYPYKDDTVPFSILAMTGCLVPLLVVFSGEFFRFTLSRSHYNDYETHYELCGLKIPAFLSSAVRINALFAYGALICVSVTDITKYSVGRLRPHFLPVCANDLDWAKIVCGNSTGNTYITDPFCPAAKSTDPAVLARFEDSRLSFLSGHSSFSFYCAFFVIYYLETRLKWMNMRFFKAFFQSVVFMGAALCGASRVRDNKHHPTDVLAGSFLGFVVATVVVFVVGDYFLDRRALRAKVRGYFKTTENGKCGGDIEAAAAGRQYVDMDFIDSGKNSDPKMVA